MQCKTSTIKRYVNLLTGSVSFIEENSGDCTEIPLERHSGMSSEEIIDQDREGECFFNDYM